MAVKILVVDDDPDIRDILRLTLAEENYVVLEAKDGEEAIKAITTKSLDLVLLDYKIPKIDGREVCRRVKSDLLLRHLPIIMLTAKTQEADKIVGLELGADDYVTKPFSPRELIARVKAVLRRMHEKEKLPEVLKTGNLTLDFSKIMVYVKNRPVGLTTKEFELLKILIKANGRVLSRDYLLDTIWGFDHAVEIQTRTVDVHIRTLRKKLKSEAKRIITVKNYGYRFQIDED